MGNASNFKPSGRRFRHHIQGRLVFILLAFLIPLLMIQSLTFYDRFQTERSEELETNLDVARAVGRAFDEFVGDVLRQEHAIASAVTASPPLSHLDLTRLLEQSAKEFSGARFHWVGPEGRILASSRSQAIGFGLSDRPYFKEIESGREWVVSDLTISKFTDKPAITICRGIRDQGGKLLGLAVAAVDPEQLDSALPVQRPKGGGITLSDSKGMLVYRFPHITVNWDERNWAKIYSVTREALAGREATGLAITHFDGKKRFMAASPIRSIGWVAGAGRIEDEVIAPILADLAKSAVLFLLVAIAAFLVALFGSRRIAHHVHALRSHALALERGEWGAPLKISRIAEFQDLADGFNKMAEEVRLREQALRESEGRCRDLVHRANSAIVRWKSDGTITLFNEYAQAFFGYSEDEAVGKHVSMLVPEKESTGADLTMLSRDMVSYPERYIQNINENIRRDGSRVWMAWTNKAILDENGAVAEILAVGTDITERKRMEEELRKSRDELELRVRERTAELERSNQALQDFASVASHDMKEPLRKVISFSNALLQKHKDTLGQTGNDYLNRIIDATQRMQSLLTSLLEYSAVTINPEPFQGVDLSDLIREVLSDLDVRIAKTGGEVQVGDLPTIKADPAQMRQLFQNLIVNALKFHKDGEKPIVKISWAKSDTANCRIIVEDNGIGFEEHHLEKIFSPFHRLHGRSSRYEGAGMGLAICKKIVERHGGCLTATSAPGHGSTFMVSLPIKRNS